MAEGGGFRRLALRWCGGGERKGGWSFVEAAAGGEWEG